MWGRWYFVMFLFRDGLFTLICILILWWFWPGSSPLYLLCWNYQWMWMFCGVSMVINGEGSLQMFLELFSKCSWWSQSTLSHLKLYITPLFWWYGLNPWEPPEGHDGLTSFEVHFYPVLSTCFCKTFTESLYVWENYMGLILVTRCTLILLVVTVVTGVVPRTRYVDALEFTSVHYPFRVFTFL